jgi:peroxiredoxin
MRALLPAAALAGLLVSTVMAQTPAPGPVDLKAGDKAPDFSLQGTDGKTHTLAEYKGQWVVLAWFPKAFTGG